MTGTLTVKRYSTLRVWNIRRDIVTLEIAGPRGQRLEASWPEGVAVDPAIDPEKKYRVDLLTRVYTDPDYVFNDVLRISDEDGVMLDASKCSVHKIAMQRQVEVGKSAEAYSRSFILRREREFPNDGNAYLACGSGIRHLTWKCPECEKAYHRWTKQHGIDESW